MRQVNNQLEVVPAVAKKAVDAKDVDVTEGVQLAFKDHLELQSVTASVKNGVVRLTGTVLDGWDQLTAVRLARTVNGARGVTNELKLDESASPRN